MISKNKIYLSLLLLMTYLLPAYSGGEPLPAITQSIDISELADYPTAPIEVKKMVQQALLLTQKQLTYQFGSADPKNKGMDCSGTLYYLLNQAGISQVPRQTDTLFNWVKDKGKLHLVNDNNINSPEFSMLRIGDLLFWSGTYETHRASPISHVMLYLGKNRQGQRIMFGASDGRRYQGKKMRGVSIFDFKLPNGKGPQRFVGYSCIPSLSCH